MLGYQGAPSVPPITPLLAERLELDTTSGRVLLEHREIELTLREAELLGMLIRAPGVHHTSDDLARRLSNCSPCQVSRQSVIQTISNVRRKVGDSARNPHLLVHRCGFGYAWKRAQMASTRTPEQVTSAALARAGIHS
jgi:DNA-binding response OmpR family regulator